MNIYSIYKITNQINGKIYIGFTSYLNNRWKKHIFDTKNNNQKTDSNKILHNAMRKYGVENFSYEVIFQSKDKDFTLNEMEKHFIQEYNSHCINNTGYNATYGGQGTFGPKTEQHKNKLRMANLGKIMPDNVKDKIRSKHLGKTFCEQHRLKLSEAQKKKVLVNGKQYESGRSAAKENNVSPSTIVKWLKNGKAAYI